jgi:hypothetical protein
MSAGCIAAHGWRSSEDAGSDCRSSHELTERQAQNGRASLQRHSAAKPSFPSGAASEAVPLTSSLQDRSHDTKRTLHLHSQTAEAPAALVGVAIDEANWSIVLSAVCDEEYGCEPPHEEVLHVSVLPAADPAGSHPRQAVLATPCVVRVSLDTAHGLSSCQQHQDGSVRRVVISTNGGSRLPLHQEDAANRSRRVQFQPGSRRRRGRSACGLRPDGLTGSVAVPNVHAALRLHDSHSDGSVGNGERDGERSSFDCSSHSSAAGGVERLALARMRSRLSQTSGVSGAYAGEPCSESQRHLPMPPHTSRSASVPHPPHAQLSVLSPELDGLREASALCPGTHAMTMTASVPLGLVRSRTLASPVILNSSSQLGLRRSILLSSMTREVRQPSALGRAPRSLSGCPAVLPHDGKRQPRPGSRTEPNSIFSCS